jgi:hypothetical protein
VQNDSISSMNGWRHEGIRSRSFHSRGYQLNCSIPSAGPLWRLKPNGCLYPDHRPVSGSKRSRDLSASEILLYRYWASENCLLS